MPPSTPHSSQTNNTVPSISEPITTTHTLAYPRTHAYATLLNATNPFPYCSPPIPNSSLLPQYHLAVRTTLKSTHMHRSLLLPAHGTGFWQNCTLSYYGIGGCVAGLVSPDAAYCVPTCTAFTLAPKPLMLQTNLSVRRQTLIQQHCVLFWNTWIANNNTRANLNNLNKPQQPQQTSTNLNNLNKLQQPQQTSTNFNKPQQSQQPQQTSTTSTTLTNFNNLNNLNKPQQTSTNLNNLNKPQQTSHCSEFSKEDAPAVTPCSSPLATFPRTNTSGWQTSAPILRRANRKFAPGFHTKSLHETRKCQGLPLKQVGKCLCNSVQIPFPWH